MLEGEPRNPSAFEERVYDAIRQIPKGRVTTYGALAKRVGCGSSQAVGQALKRNPFAPKVPCHRVISSTLNIAGYMGRTEGAEVQRKMSLLAAEGVEFDASGKLLDEKLLIEAW